MRKLVLAAAVGLVALTGLRVSPAEAAISPLAADAVMPAGPPCVAEPCNGGPARPCAAAPCPLPMPTVVEDASSLVGRDERT